MLYFNDKAIFNSGEEVKAVLLSLPLRLSLPPSLPFPSFIDDLMPRCAVHTTVKAAPSCIDRISFDKSEDYSENCDKRHSK